ncbi:lysine ketoglutarate reductase trans-splicing related 1 [Musa troglodytarum]|uniref:Lysine ketoglutarate reductase trans-splicing related 1 n=1 Tax=Musa troglodytarum TaxID=320322 RepID=A0A9E7FPD3_9LILI|nr:lysine ketoglutarate reductase trans-splicing related 1 [Musa troglodytarum]URD99621.1 lysine ketoglutarate reductase trans-splicing related 1 [Musa troglodytarum]
MKKRTSLGLVALFTAVTLLLTMNLQFEHLEMEVQQHQPFVSTERPWRSALQGLPRGIVESTSDLELKPLWKSTSFESRVETSENYSALLAMAVGILQKENVDSTVRKFLIENCSIILFHYDGNVDGWRDLQWNNKAVHIVARNQTKWWFAKRFLHPDVVSVYDYIFLWDEDLGVENFHPGRYLHIMSSEGLEISQPALDPDLSSDIHHRITVRNRMTKVHRRIYDQRGSLRCSDESKGPPCTGWVEGMAPVFSRAAWQCAWHLIQNDLVHGWGLDMKLGYCAQGDRTEKVGVIDTEFIVHMGIPSLGGSSINKIRRQSTAELKIFKARWNKAVNEDREWFELSTVKPVIGGETRASHFETLEIYRIFQSRSLHKSRREAAMTSEEDPIVQASKTRRERLSALRAAKEYHSMPDDAATEGEAKDPADDHVVGKEMDAEEDPIEQAASARRERIKALKMAKELLDMPDEAVAKHDSKTEDSEDEMPSMKFRNYLPHDKQLQEGKVAPATLPKFEDPVAAAPLPPEKIEDPFLNIAPKKPNWDLRRDVQKKLDKLERRTQKALYKLMQEQEKEKETMDVENSVAED